MKIKEIYTCMVAALSVFCACSSEMDPLINAGTTPGQLTFTADDFEYDQFQYNSPRSRVSMGRE